MTNKTRQVALFGNTYQASKSACTEQVIGQLLARGVDVALEEEFARFIESRLSPRITAAIGHFNREAPLRADMALSMGGDGTFLKTASLVRDSGVPILGINTGNLGFLADVALADIDRAADAIVQGHYTVEPRSVIAVSVELQEGGSGRALPLEGYPFALNEVALLKYDNSSLINVSTHIDGALLADYVADGLIICTPTGSTGYSLSVNGPIISPSSGSFCISAVAPHSLNVRPVILNDDAEITLRVSSRSHKYLISIDGRSETLPEDAVVTLRRAAHTIGVVKIRHLRFFDTLRDKLGWAGDQR